MQLGCGVIVIDTDWNVAALLSLRESPKLNVLMNTVSLMSCHSFDEWT